MVNIVDLMKKVRSPLVDGLEDIAARLATGSEVPPEEIAAVLQRTRCQEPELQRAVDRHARVLELRREIKAAEPRKKKLAAIEAEYAEAQAELAKWQKRINEWVAKNGVEVIDLRIAVARGEAAKNALMDSENLPPADAANLSAVRQTADHADTSLTATSVAVVDARKSLRDAEERLLAANEESAAFPANQDAAAGVRRWRNAVKARSAALQEAEKALRAADAALKAARQEREVVEAAVRLSVGVA
jgi:hypothetical protein